MSVVRVTRYVLFFLSLYISLLTLVRVCVVLPSKLANLHIPSLVFLSQENIQGLAHFLEHLLFLGTSKYPRENEYLEYLSQHSGSRNAFTGPENTNYYFDVGRDYLEGALDR